MSAARLSQSGKKPISERISIFEQSKQQTLSVTASTTTKSHSPLSKTYSGKNFNAIKSQFSSGGESPSSSSANKSSTQSTPIKKASTATTPSTATPTTTPSPQGKSSLSANTNTATTATAAAGAGSTTSPLGESAKSSNGSAIKNKAETVSPVKDRSGKSTPSQGSKVRSSPFRIQSQNPTANTSKPATLSASSTPSPPPKSSAFNNINRVPVTPSARASAHASSASKSQTSSSASTTSSTNQHQKLQKTSSTSSSGRTTPVKRTPSNSSIGSSTSTTSAKRPIAKSQTLPIQPVSNGAKSSSSGQNNSANNVTINVKKTTLTTTEFSGNSSAKTAATRVVREKSSTSPIIPSLTVTRENSLKSLPKVSEVVQESLNVVQETSSSSVEDQATTEAPSAQTLDESPSEVLPVSPPKVEDHEKSTHVEEPEPSVSEEETSEPASLPFIYKDEEDAPRMPDAIEESEDETTPDLVPTSERGSSPPPLSSMSPVPSTIYEEDEYRGRNERVIEEKTIIISDRRKKPSLHNQTSTLVIETLDPKQNSGMRLEHNNRKNSLTNGKGSYNHNLVGSPTYWTNQALLNDTSQSLREAMKLDLDYKDEKISALSKELEDLHSGGTTDEEVSSLKRQKNDLEKRLKDQEEELDDMAGQVQMLEQAKIKLEMSMAALKKDHRREISSKEDELEDARNAAMKKVKALEQQLESEHEERIGFVREKHELETKIINLQDLASRSTDEDVVAKLKKDLKRTKALLKDAQYMLERSRNETSNKSLIRQLKNQLEDAEFARISAIKAKQNTDLELSDVQQQLDDVMRSKSDVEDKLFRIGREKADLATQLEDNDSELSEVMKKYKASVGQLSVDQITIHEQANAISDLEEERNQLKEQLAEFTAKVQSMEGENVSTAQHHRLELKIKELESKLDLEQTTRGRMETQINRLKEAIEKINIECDQLRGKEHSAQELVRKLQRQLRDLKEEFTNLQAKETEVNSKKNELEKMLELAEAETVTAKNDLKLAMKRIEDLQTAMNGEIDSDSDSILSDGDSDSSDDDVSNIFDRRASHLTRGSISRTLEPMPEEPESQLHEGKSRPACHDSDSDADPSSGKPSQALLDETDRTGESQA